MNPPKFHPLTQAHAEGIDWVPQAIFTRPIEDCRQPGTFYHEGWDDLDYYRGVYFFLGGINMAVIRRHGYPDGRCCLNFPHEVVDQDVITAYIRVAMHALGFDPKGDLEWERQMGLEESVPM